MGYYSFYKIFKDILRTIFGRKIIRILFVLLFIIFIFFIFNKIGVFAESIYTVNSNFYDNTVINQARLKVGDTVWNDESYDILLVYNGQNATGTNYFNQGYSCYVFKTDLLPSTYYKFFNPTRTNTISGVSYQTGELKLINDSSTFSVFDQHRYFLNSSWQDDVSSLSNVNLAWLGFDTLVPSGSNTIIFQPIRTHFDLYDEDGNFLYGATNPITVNPYFETTDEELQTFDFDYLKINGGTTPYYTQISEGLGGNATLNLKYIYNGVTTNIDLTNYISVNSNNTWSVNIPYNVLTNNVIIRDEKEFSYIFTYTPYYGSQIIVSKLNLIYNLTTEEEENINQDSEKQVQGEILQQQQDTNNKLDNIDNTIANSSIDDITNNTLPSDNTQDITANGVNGIFASIYNAFCTGNAQDIVFPIPFTDKNITLSPHYVSDMLTNSGATWVVTIIQAFWWYLISRFIIKDIMDKINKIKSGNIEEIETSNIRGDML